MGRGSKQARKGKAAAARAPPSAITTAAAAPATATAAAEPPALEHDEHVWRLLLGEMWQPPEQAVVCRLLCCSRAMAALVAALYSGSLALVARTQEEQPRRVTRQHQQQLEEQGRAFSRWIETHAHLLASMRVNLGDWEEQYVAGGLRAAADAGATSTAQEAAAHPLSLLRSLVCVSRPMPWRPTGARMAACLPACAQLTELELSCTLLYEGQQQLAAALPVLTCLRALSLCISARYYFPKLLLGKQLTRLQLVGVALFADGITALPASLVELEYQPPEVTFNADAVRPPLAISHLAALQRLGCISVRGCDAIPPHVKDLRVKRCDRLLVLHSLTQLQSLQIRDATDGTLEQLRAAVSAIGTSLTALDWNVGSSTLGPQLLSQVHTGPPAVPLTGLTVTFWDALLSFAHLGQWTGLTRLQLQACRIYGWAVQQPVGRPQQQQSAGGQQQQQQQLGASIWPAAEAGGSGANPWQWFGQQPGWQHNKADSWSRGSPGALQQQQRPLAAAAADSEGNGSCLGGCRLDQARRA